MINVEVTDQAGARRVLMVRFPRAKLAIWTGVATIIIFSSFIWASWFITPTYNAGAWWWPWVIVLANAIIWGWFLVLLLITAVRGGYLALTPTGVLIQTGLSSVLIPWTAISGTSARADGTKTRNPLLRLSIRSDYKVPGWPWPVALHPVLIGSSRRKLQIYAWWFQSVPLDRMVAIVGYLVSHPDERSRIGSADPDKLAQGPAGRGPGRR